MDLIVYSIPAFFILIGVEWIVARMKKSPVYRFSDAITNINCGTAQQVSNVLLKSATFLIYVAIYENHRIFPNIPMNAFTWIALFVGVDFFYYLFHRYAHEIALFWGSHIVHHQSEEYNLSVALRQSTTQTLVSIWFYLPLAWIGFSPVAFLTISSIQTLYQFWIHTKLIHKMPIWFEYVFNTPSHHRVHHGVDPKYIDRNHGGTLIIFDRMFGTFQAEEEEVHFGVTKQLKSWDPVWANIDYYKDLWNNFITAKGIKDKTFVLVKKPGWRPAYAGGPIEPKPVSKDYTKYDDHSTKNINNYVLIHFAIVLAGTSFFLFRVDSFSWMERIFSVGLILLAVMTNGYLMENKRISIPLEIVRFILTTAFLGWYFNGKPQFIAIIIVSIILSVISVSFLLLQKKNGALER